MLAFKLNQFYYFNFGLILIKHLCIENQTLEILTHITKWKFGSMIMFQSYASLIFYNQLVRRGSVTHFFLQILINLKEGYYADDLAIMRISYYEINPLEEGFLSMPTSSTSISLIHSVAHTHTLSPRNTCQNSLAYINWTVLFYAIFSHHEICFIKYLSNSLKQIIPISLLLTKYHVRNKRLPLYHTYSLSQDS